jgi:periplasmic copper chaperone A
MYRTLFLSAVLLVGLAACDNLATPSEQSGAPADIEDVSAAGPGVSVESNGLRPSSSIEAPSAAYLVLRGDGRSMTLTRVTSTEAFDIEIHESFRANGMTSMRPVERIDIPADGEVAMRPGGLHLMIFGISETARAAEKLPLTLEFADGTRLTVEVSVADLNASERGAADHSEDHSNH